MKGLMIKDMLTLKKQGKIMILLLIFYIGYSIYTKNSIMLGLVVTIFSMMLPITSLAYDEFGKWDKYALSLPVDRKTVVMSKYLLSLLISVCGFILLTPVAIIISINGEDLTVSGAVIVMACSVLISMFMVSLMLPIIFKLGVEKARLIQMLIVFVPTLIVMLIPSMGITLPSQTLVVVMMVSIPILIIALYVASIFVSLKIYCKKEF